MKRVLRGATFLMAGCIAGWSTGAWADTSSGDDASVPAVGSIGAACTTADACGSGFCVGGVCCDLACDNPCEACNLPGAEGTCSLSIGTLFGGGTNACSSVPSTPPGDGSTASEDGGSAQSLPLKLASAGSLVSRVSYAQVRDGGSEPDASESPDESVGCSSTDGLALLALLVPGLLLARRRTR